MESIDIGLSHRCLCHPCSRLTRLAELTPNKNASSTHESRASDWPAPDPPHHGQTPSRWRRVRTSAHPLAARLGIRLGHLSEQSLHVGCESCHQGNCGQGDCVGVHNFSSDLGHTSQYDCMCTCVVHAFMFLVSAGSAVDMHIVLLCLC